MGTHHTNVVCSFLDARTHHQPWATQKVSWITTYSQLHKPLVAGGRSILNFHASNNHFTRSLKGEDEPFAPAILCWHSRWSGHTKTFPRSYHGCAHMWASESDNGDAEAQGGFDSASIAESGHEIKAAAMPLGMMECGAVRRTMHCPPCPACSLISSIHVYGGFCPRFDTALGIGMSQKVGIHETAVSRSPYHFITHTVLLHTKVVSKNYVIIQSIALVLESYSRSLDDHATK
jgi:hypothetical protein